ncbi:hypothetical protein CYY_008133 [Polysphondylium violaceum]|uniref:Band 7 domain-containing protein n=1 Tax=Polysphondylium violaceum TaxID=133409 RepID=A0A8J4UXI8_9MYCE|nr:hypothetical protein CYY_008133 [Polysphondylium violaceum]
MPYVIDGSSSNEDSGSPNNSSNEPLEENHVALAIALYIIVFTFLILALIINKKVVKIVSRTQVMIIERFGKYHTTLNPGLHFLLPFIDSPKMIHWRHLDVPTGSQKPQVVLIDTDRIDMREHVITFGRQHVITKDTVQINIDALMYIQIADPKAAVYRVQNLPDSVELLAQTTLRNIIATLTLDDTFSSREFINAQLKEKTIKDAERWGVIITRVEVMSIRPPNDIKEAMEMQLTKEREKRSHILNAEGEKEGLIIKSKGMAAKIVLTSEAEKTVATQNAKGIAESKRLSAGADVEVIRLIRKAINNPDVSTTGYLVTSQYLDRLSSLPSKDTNLILVPESSLNFASNISTSIGSDKKNN